MEMSAVEWLIDELGEYFPNGIGGINLMINKAKEMEKQQSQEYAEFCINCYREDYPILDFESYIKVKERHGQSNI